MPLLLRRFSKNCQLLFRANKLVWVFSVVILCVPSVDFRKTKESFELHKTQFCKDIVFSQSFRISVAWNLHTPGLPSNGNITSVIPDQFENYLKLTILDQPPRGLALSCLKDSCNQLCSWECSSNPLMSQVYQITKLVSLQFAISILSAIWA